MTTAAPSTALATIQPAFTDAGGIPVGGQHAVELAAGGDAELGEDVAEVVLGGARAG
jgi:hypothetical protein